jgi:hypothetical protein
VTGGEQRRLTSGLDTIQFAYYLRPQPGAAFNFERLMVAKERLRADKSRKGELLCIGGESFLVQGYGSKSGYPLVLDYVDFNIECGEFNNPSFFVTYRSKALWEKGAKAPLTTRQVTLPAACSRRSMSTGVTRLQSTPREPCARTRGAGFSTGRGRRSGIGSLRPKHSVTGDGEERSSPSMTR